MYSKLFYATGDQDGRDVGEGRQTWEETNQQELSTMKRVLEILKTLKHTINDSCCALWENAKVRSKGLSSALEDRSQSSGVDFHCQGSNIASQNHTIVTVDRLVLNRVSNTHAHMHVCTHVRTHVSRNIPEGSEGK